MATALSETDNGKFVRTEATFREIISPTHPKFKPEFGRYHLYISYACPWANRCLAVIKMKRLEKCITVSVVHPTWRRTRPDDATDSHMGWAFNAEPLWSPTELDKFQLTGCTPDQVNGTKFIRDLYELAGYTGKKFTVPVLWDKKLKTIVSNESSEIVRMISKEFQEWATGTYFDLDLYPERLRSKIDDANAWIYPGINDGVYRCGFAQTQKAYDEAINSLEQALDRLEDLLSKQRFVVGDVFTEADLRLFMTLVRFDEVYVVYFKCNVKKLIEYPNIRHYCRDVFQMSGIRESIRMDHIKMHYFTSHPTLNTYGIIPKGPNSIAEFSMTHDRIMRSYMP